MATDRNCFVGERRRRAEHDACVNLIVDPWAGRGAGKKQFDPFGWGEVGGITPVHFFLV